MTRTTSSSSVHGTTEGPRQDQTGRQFIETNYGPTSKQRMGDWEYRWWTTKAALRHLIGIHTLIQHERWYKVNGEWRVEIDGVSCWRCDYRER
jgi:hypothetical protein